MQRDAKRVRKQLKKVHVEAESAGVKVVVNGEQEVIRIEIAADVPKESLPALLMDTLNRALKKAQVVSAQHMQEVMGDMGLPTEEGMRGMGS